MGVEIERKFLVCGNEWQRLATGRTRIQQAYLPAEASLSMRVRIKNEDYATLTLKSRETELRRLERQRDELVPKTQYWHRSALHWLPEFEGTRIVEEQ